jgi:predicted NBD/HSP70 family sugar kinase
VERATHQTTRRANERLVLRTIYERASISRADVARATGLTRTTVSDVVDGLIADALVEESGTGPSTGGKAPILLAVPDGARHLIGVDVDRDRLRGVVVDLRGRIVRRRTRSLKGRDGEAALRDLEALVGLLVRGAKRPLLGVGVGTAGLVDVRSGIVRWAVGLDWRDLPLKDRLDERIGLPVRVMNDSKAAAVAEWTFDRRPDEGSMLVINVADGVGAGIIVRGRLLDGDDGGAGEIGHVRVTDDGAGCRCGSDGCLETVASLRAVMDRARRLAAATHDRELEVEMLTETGLVRAWRGGDPIAREVVSAAAVALGRMIGAVTGALDVRDVVIVGRMLAFGPAWLELVRAEARRSSLPLLAERQRIRAGGLGPDVVELGAAAMLMSSELGLALAA